MKLKLISAILAIISILSAICLVGCNKWKEDPYLVLVNKSNTVKEDYAPEKLVTVDPAYTTGGKSLELEEKTAEAAIKMLDAMKKDGITNVSITSAYRTYAYQQTLFDRYFAQEKAAHPDWSDEQVKDYVLTYSAFPGMSEHQTGLCMDLFTTEMEGLWNYGDETPDNPYDKGFAETEAYEWLCEHAHEYGFVLRFPKDKTDVTGYAYESWHYRYVGVEHAEKMHKKGLTLEEYLD